MGYLFRKDLEHLRPVQINVPHEEVMMCLNEAPFDAHTLLGEPFLRRLGEMPLNRYFNEVTRELGEELSAYVGHGVGPDQILTGNGADEMLYYLFTALRDEPGSRVIAPAPSYFDYKSYAAAVGLGVSLVDLTATLEIDVEAMISAASPPLAKALILCNPNNPTGNLMEPAKIQEVLERTSGLVIIDETYFEFSQHTSLPLLASHPHLVIVRSFSKAFGAAGLRFGYALGSREVIGELSKVRTAFNLSLLTQAAVLFILRHRQPFLEGVEALCRARDEMARELETGGVRVLRTETNFLPFSLGPRSAALHAHLTDHGVAVRDVGGHRLLRDFLRVTVSSPADNRRFLDLVNEFISV